MHTIINCVINWNIYKGASAGEKLWGREQAGAGEERPVGKEAGIAAKTSSSVVPEPPCSVEDKATWKGLWSPQIFLWCSPF